MTQAKAGSGQQRRILSVASSGTRKIFLGERTELREEGTKMCAEALKLFLHVSVR